MCTHQTVFLDTMVRGAFIIHNLYFLGCAYTLVSRFISKRLWFGVFRCPFLTKHPCTIVRLYSCYVQSIDRVSPLARSGAVYVLNLVYKYSSDHVLESLSRAWSSIISPWPGRWAAYCVRSHAYRQTIE